MRETYPQSETPAAVRDEGLRELAEGLGYGEEVARNQDVIAEVVAEFGGDVEDQAVLEGVFIDGLPDADIEDNRVFTQLRQTAQRLLNDGKVNQTGRDFQDLKHALCAYQFQEQPALAAAVNKLWQDYQHIPWFQGLPTFLRAQAEHLEDIVNYQHTAAQRLGAAAVSRNGHHEAKGGEIDSCQSESASLNGQTAVTAQALAEYIRSGADIGSETLEVPVHTIKAALQMVAGDEALEKPDSDAQHRFQWLNAYITPYLPPINRAHPGFEPTPKVSGEDRIRQLFAQAECLKADPDAFFPEKGELAAPAKRICAHCDVRYDCLEHALDNSEKGVWGGLTEQERRNLKKLM